MPKIRRNGKITYLTWSQYQTHLTRKIIGNNFTEHDVNKIYSYFYNDSKEQIEQQTKSWPDKNDEVYLIGQYIVSGGDKGSLLKAINGEDKGNNSENANNNAVLKELEKEIYSLSEYYFNWGINEVKGTALESLPEAVKDEEDWLKIYPNSNMSKSIALVGKYVLNGGNINDLKYPSAPSEVGGDIKVNGYYSPTDQHSDYTDSEKQALYDYTRSSNINYRLAYNEMTDAHWEMMRNMDSAIKKSQFTEDYHYGDNGIKLRRGGGGIMIGVPETTEFTTKELADYINKNLIGTEHVNVGYTSITKGDVAGGFAWNKKNPIIMEYARIDKGVHSAYVSGKGKNGTSPISYYRNRERESVMQRGIVTVPVRARVENGDVIVTVIAHKPNGSQFEI